MRRAARKAEPIPKKPASIMSHCDGSGTLDTGTPPESPLPPPKNGRNIGVINNGGPKFNPFSGTGGLKKDSAGNATVTSRRGKLVVKSINGLHRTLESTRSVGIRLAGMRGTPLAAFVWTKVPELLWPGERSASNSKGSARTAAIASRVGPGVIAKNPAAAAKDANRKAHHARHDLLFACSCFLRNLFISPPRLIYALSITLSFSREKTTTLEGRQGNRGRLAGGQPFATRPAGEVKAFEGLFRSGYARPILLKRQGRQRASPCFETAGRA